MNTANSALPYAAISVRKTATTQTTTGVLGNNVVVSFQTTDQQNGTDINLTSATEITVLKKGIYRIGYDIKQSAGANDVGTLVKVNKGITTIPASYSYGSCRAAAETPSVGSVFICELAANDVLTLLSENREAAAHTVELQSTWWVELVRVLP